MSTNKNATIRYNALDKCFRNYGRRYFMEDLIEVCNEALDDFNGTGGVKKRQIYADIKFMESEQGWSIDLCREKEGKKTYYRYKDKDFSILNQPINETEANQLKEILTVLSRFEGMPQFDWVQEMLVRVESIIKLKGKHHPIVGFEQNPYLVGLKFFTELFHAIYYEKVLQVTYQSFKQEEPVKLEIHPYYLKQYNNRWFLFGFNRQQDAISNLALDRILKIEEIRKDFIKNEEIDFEEYFEDVVGVSVFKDRQPVKVLLKISEEQFPYIKSKPLHGSQKIKENTEQGIFVELEVQLNYEFVSLLKSYGDTIEVVHPEQLRKEMKVSAESVLKKYS